MRESSSNNPALITRRVNQAIDDPAKALDKGWYENPFFCRRFFDRCEDIALANERRALPLAQRAVEMAVANGDSCLINLSESLLAHAHLSLWDKFWAARTLEKNRDSAMDCCHRCRGDFFRRQGDILAEENRPKESLKAFNRCLAEDRDLSDDTLARVCFPRSVALYYCGQPELALRDIGQVFERLSLDSPRGYFLDSAAFVAVYLQLGTPCFGDPDEDPLRLEKMGLEMLDRFLQRIHKMPWKDVRTRIRWVQGHLRARLGQTTRALELLDMACRVLLKDGLPREIAAAVIDLGQLKTRPSNLREDNLASALRWIKRCLDQRADLAKEHRAGLLEIVELFKTRPEEVCQRLVELRRTVTAPVPGVLGRWIHR